MNKKRPWRVGLAFALGSAAVYAAEDRSTDRSQTYAALAPVVVTASRIAETADEALASVTVITREDLEQGQVPSVEDALRTVAGITVSRNGGRGKNASVFLRGAESDQVLVLIDGIKVGSATVGQTAFQDIPIEQVERIEIVRGPRSSLYGSEAIGGVIQIFTRRGGGSLRPYVSLGTGSHNTSTVLAGVQGGGERSWYNLSFSNLDTQGFNACSPPNAFSGCFALEPDRDAYRNRSYSLRAGRRFQNGVEVDVRALRARGKNEFDGTFVNESKTVQQVLGGTLKFSPFRNWRMTLAGGQSRDESDDFLDDFQNRKRIFQSAFDTRRDTITLQNDVALGASQVLTAGYDYLNDNVNSTERFTVASRYNHGVFAQYRGQFKAHDLQGALRYDNNEQFGTKVTGNAAWGYTVFKGIRAFVSYGTAFKAPTFNELFFPGFGNPDLGPETAQSVEAGVRGTHRGWSWSLNAFQTHIDNLIAFDAATFLPQNVDEARIRGLEGSASATINQWKLAANFTLMDPENRGSGPNQGNVLPRRAEQSFHLNVDRRFRNLSVGGFDLGRFSLGATLSVEGRRFDDLANTRRLGGYATVDLRAEYRPHKDWALQLRVANLFDKDYQTAAFFNQEGTTVFLTLRYRPSGT